MKTIEITLASLALSTLSFAQSPQCTTLTSMSGTTNLFEDLAFPQFDPAQGALTSVEVTLTVDAVGLLNIENTNPTSETFMSNFSVRGEVWSPGQTVLLAQSTPALALLDTLSAFDGSGDFQGPSATGYTGLQLNGMATGSSIATPTDLTPFIGNSTVDIPVAVLDVSTVTAPGTFIFQTQQTATVTVELCYTFQPDASSSCDGDGGDQMGCTFCPCGNDAPSGTSGGCLNSSGASARLVTRGTPSVSAGDLRLEMSGGVAGSFAVLTSGASIAPQNPQNPCFGTGNGVQSAVLDGLRCAVQNVLRHGGRPVAADGTVGMGLTNGWGPPNGPLNGMGGIAAQGGFTPGQTRQFQVFYRELPGTVCLTEQNTSQVRTVSFTP